MSLTPPSGYVTRPEAARNYNRSQRALERDVTDALARQDAAVLTHWKLVTKDGNVFDPTEVTKEHVDKLVADGMVPTWCVEELWLDETYGRKGSRVRRRSSRPSIEPAETPSGGASWSGAESASDEEGDSDASSSSASLPNDVDFLKERIRTLEREKREETARNEKREAKLFDQMAVKDRQISAWDEVTQGLTKALATGQLTPTLIAPPRDRPREESAPDSSSKPIHDASVVEAPRQRQGTTARRGTGADQTAARNMKPKKRKPAQPPASKPKWYETPTLRRLFRR